LEAAVADIADIAGAKRLEDVHRRQRSLSDFELVGDFGLTTPSLIFLLLRSGAKDYEVD
jgi:hypothetical protein